MRGHILIVNTPAHDDAHCSLWLLEHFPASDRHRDHTILILSNAFPGGLPERFARLDNIAHQHGRCKNRDSQAAANLYGAAGIFVLTKEEHDHVSDGALRTGT